MTYSNELKCSSDIFDIFYPIHINEDLVITWLYQNLPEIESKMLLEVSNNKEVKDFLPGMFMESETEAKKKFQDLIGQQVFQRAIVFCIRISSTKVPIGYVILNSPISSYNLNEWVLDFWIKPNYRRANIMTFVLYNIFKYSQEKGIRLILAQVNAENEAALKLLVKLGFVDVSQFYVQNNKEQILLGISLKPHTTG